MDRVQSRRLDARHRRCARQCRWRDRQQRGSHPAGGHAGQHGRHLEHRGCAQSRQWNADQRPRPAQRRHHARTRHGIAEQRRGPAGRPRRCEPQDSEPGQQRQRCAAEPERRALHRHAWRTQQRRWPAAGGSGPHPHRHESGQHRRCDQGAGQCTAQREPDRHADQCPGRPDRQQWRLEPRRRRADQRRHQHGLGSGDHVKPGQCLHQRRHGAGHDAESRERGPDQYRNGERHRRVQSHQHRCGQQQRHAGGGHQPGARCAGSGGEQHGRDPGPRHDDHHGGEPDQQRQLDRRRCP